MTILLVLRVYAMMTEILSVLDQKQKTDKWKKLSGKKIGYSCKRISHCLFRCFPCSVPLSYTQTSFSKWIILNRSHKQHSIKSEGLYFLVLIMNCNSQISHCGRMEVLNSIPNNGVCIQNQMFWVQLIKRTIVLFVSIVS